MITIGKIKDGEHKGQSLTIDLKRLIQTRLVVNANSGGGKSWLIRNLPVLSDHHRRGMIEY